MSQKTAALIVMPDNTFRYVKPKMGPLDPLPTFSEERIVALVLHDPCRALWTRVCPVCTALAATARPEQAEIHLRNSPTCRRQQGGYWAHAHGWKLIGDVISSVNASPSRRRLKKWREWILRAGGITSGGAIPPSALPYEDIAAPAWIVDAIAVFEATPALREMGQQRYLDAVIKPVRQALGLEP